MSLSLGYPNPRFEALADSAMCDGSSTPLTCIDEKQTDEMKKDIKEMLLINLNLIIL